MRIGEGKGADVRRRRLPQAPHAGTPAPGSRPGSFRAGSDVPRPASVPSLRSVRSWLPRVPGAHANTVAVRRSSLERFRTSPAAGALQSRLEWRRSRRSPLTVRPALYGRIHASHGLGIVVVSVSIAAVGWKSSRRVRSTRIVRPLVRFASGASGRSDVYRARARSARVPAGSRPGAQVRRGRARRCALGADEGPRTLDIQLGKPLRAFAE